MTTGTNDTSQYYASAEPSPQPSQRISTPTPSNGSGPLQQTDYEYITGPTPRRGLLTKLGAPPSRNELNTMVARQQNRIVDLTLQNNVLVNQIELLRSEVQDMKVSAVENNRSNELHTEQRSAAMSPPPRPASRDQDFRQVFGSERPTSQGESRDLSGGTTGRTPRRNRQSFDPHGWRRIVGVREEQDTDGDGDVDMHMDREVDKDDKRKTWMTCDS